MTSFVLDWYFIVLIFSAGLYCMLASRSLLRQFIGLEIMLKSCLLGIVSAGALTGNLALAQALAATMIIIEAAVMATALALLVKAHSLTGSADARSLKNPGG